MKAVGWTRFRGNDRTFALNRVLIGSVGRAAPALLAYGEAMRSASLSRHLPSVPTYARLLGQLRPLDRALAVSDFWAGLPLIGRYFEPLGTVTAVAAWTARYAAARRHFDETDPPKAASKPPGSSGAPELSTVTAAALRDVVAAEQLAAPWGPPERVAPALLAGVHRRRFRYRRGVRYGDAPQQRLDVWRLRDLGTGPAPVMVFVPGGGWIHGGRQLQGYSLMSHMAALGWVCLSVQYRVAPHHRWPRHVRDVKAALAWTRAHVGEFGGDPRFVAIAGCSAGGHLAALAGLTDDDGYTATPEPHAAASVDAVVSLYGRYDWMDRSTPERDDFVRFLERIVVRQPIDGRPGVFRDASPIARVHADAPPFLVIHGGVDSVIPVAQAHAFVQRLRTASRSPVAYLELPGAGHGFDLTSRHHTQAATMATGLFLNQVHRAYLHSSRPAAS
jgi:acetyl esterase/lipase